MAFDIKALEREEIARLLAEDFKGSDKELYERVQYYLEHVIRTSNVKPL